MTEDDKRAASTPSSAKNASNESDIFTEKYSARDGKEDWDVLDEEKWSMYSRLESFRRFVAWCRGEGWRGYENYIGTPILYPNCTNETIEQVVNSAEVQRTIQNIAQARVSAMLACAHNGKISPEYVRAYLKNPNMDDEPAVDTDRLSAPKPLEDYIKGPLKPGHSAEQDFFTKMRTRLEFELANRAREIVEDSAARMDSYVLAH